MDDFLVEAEKAAIEIAKGAGEILLRNHRTELDIEIKEGNPRNVVTNADKESDEFIRSELKRRFPDHGIVTEEGEPTNGNEYTWYIDPLDGTTAYSRGGDYFCVSIGLAKAEEMVVGVIYSPVTGELYYAAKGHGAFSGDKPIHVSEIDKLEQAIIFTDLSYRDDTRKAVLSSMLKLHGDLRSMKIKGSGARSICEVASGQAEGYYYLRSNSWDYAAAAIIIREAGGVVTDLQGKTWTPESDSIVVINGKLSETMLQRINEVVEEN
jgi:myo-inositol-1(or 4)-monophosphatase